MLKEEVVFGYMCIYVYIQFNRNALNKRGWLIKLLKICRFSVSMFAFVKERKFTCNMYVYAYTNMYVHILHVNFLSFTNANILTENLQIFNNFINHPRLFKAFLLNFVLFI